MYDVFLIFIANISFLFDIYGKKLNIIPKNLFSRDPKNVPVKSLGERWLPMC